MRLFLGLFLMLLTADLAFAQTSYHKMGQKALIDGNFKAAVSNLEKALATDSSDVNTLYMLGYSYYHSASYKLAVNAFNRVILLKPAENSAFYYRGKARNIMANDTKGISNTDREKLLLLSIKDFSRAIELNAEDVKLYQNRAVAYRDYGVLKGQKIPNFYDKNKAISSFRSCISDFEKVLSITPDRRDIITQLADAKSYMQNLK
ncbi:tetratricopeptide repeat protein [Daejeonella sp.]|uniref:tetratricopeptide repeat protein n=1 Tax=Daejeonella sp. TaxID=2805397 RepID=UPI0037C0EB61